VDDDRQTGLDSLPQFRQGSEWPAQIALQAVLPLARSPSQMLHQPVQGLFDFLLGLGEALLATGHPVGAAEGENFLPPGFGQLGNAVLLEFILGEEKADQVAVQTPVLAQVFFARPELEDDERRLGLPGVEPGAELARRGARAGRVLSVAPAGGEFEGAQGTLALGAQGLLPPGGSRPDRPTSRLA
jgi:hypothetical protein